MPEKLIRPAHLFAFFLPLLIVLAAEATLRAGNHFGWHPWFTTLLTRGVSTQKTGAINAFGRASLGQCKKVAVFGDSAAAGMLSTVSFSQVLEFQLNSQPDDCYSVWNFASSGATFSNYGAEILRRVADDYDIAIVYTGHAEIWKELCLHGRLEIYDIPLQENCNQDLEHRIQQEVATSKGRFFAFSTMKDRISRWIRGDSLVYLAVQRQFTPRSVRADQASPVKDATSADAGKARKVTPPRPLERGPVVPVEKIDQMVKDYTAALQALSEAYRSRHKLLLLATPFSIDRFPPMFGYRQAGRQETAVDYFRAAEASFARGDFPAAWQAYDIAKDLDGFPYRAMGRLNKGITGMKSDAYVRTVDTEGALRSMVASGAVQFDDFLVDPEHPSFFGNTLIARQILCSLGRGQYCRVWGLAEYARFEQRFAEEAIGVVAYEKLKQRELKNSFQWHVALSRQSSEPSSFLHRAAQKLAAISVDAGNSQRKAGLTRLLASTRTSWTATSAGCKRIDEGLLSSVADLSLDFVHLAELREALKHPGLEICPA